MGGGKSGSTGTQSSNQSSTVSIPPEVLARYNSVNAQAQDVSQTPFQPYTGEFVAPINEQQQYGINQITGAGNWINPTYNNQVNSISAGLASAQPQYNAASGNITAGLAGGQSANTQALGQYGAAVGQAQPYNTAAGGLYGAATGLANAGTQAVNPTAVDSNAIGQYMSPYNNAVVQATMAQLNQQQAQQRNAQTTQQILGGSFGGDRSGIDKAVLSGQQNLATASTVSGLENQNYAQALGAAQQQQGVGLGAAQANRAAIQQGAGQVAGIGQQVAGLGQQVYGQGTGQAAFTGQIGQQGYNQALGAAGAQQGLGTAEFGTLAAAGQGYGQAGGQALQSQLAQGQAALGAGTVQQQTQQAQDTAQYNQFLQQQAYPFQTTQFLANIAEGTGALSGSTTNAATNQYTPQPFFSDRRLKENIKTIGHSSAGIPIVRYNYKGSPHTQIGMIAQDVEKKRPDAVGLAAGYKTVDYDRATRARGGLAGGGPATVIYHLGGTVTPEDAGRGFADGGAPGLDPVTMAQILAAQQAMYPGAAGRHGMGGEGPRGMQVQQGGNHQLMKADLMKMPAQQQQSTGLQEGLRDVSAAATVGKDAKTLYGLGKEAYNGTGLGAASTNKPGAVTPSDVDSSGKYVDTLPTASSIDPALPDSTLVSDVLRGGGGRAKRDVGGFIIPTLQEIGDVSGKQITRGLSGPTRPQTPLAAPTPGLAPPAPATAPPPAANNNAAPMFAIQGLGGGSSSGSANGATGDGSGSVSGDAGTVGAAVGSVSGTAGATAVGSAGENSEGPGPGSEGSTSSSDAGNAASDAGTWARGGTIKRALRYAAGGMPYGDDAVGYVPADDYQPIDPAKLEKEQKGMETPLPQMQQQKGGSDNTLGDIGQVVGIAAKLAPLLALAGGGRADNIVPFPGLGGGRRRGYQEAGAVGMDALPPQDAPPDDTSGADVLRRKQQEFLRSNTPPAPADVGERQGVDTSAPEMHDLVGDYKKGWRGLNPKNPAPPPAAPEDPTLSAEAGRKAAEQNDPRFGGTAPVPVSAPPAPGLGGGAAGATEPDVPPQSAPAPAPVKPAPGLGGGTPPPQEPMNLNSPPPQGGGAPVPTGLNPQTPAQPTTSAPKPDDRDWLQRGGDWLDKHDRLIVPALSFLGSMLSSPSRTLAGAVGSGMVGAARTEQGQQELGQSQQQIGQGQQRVDLTKRAQDISMMQQARQMYAASQTLDKPDGDPQLKAAYLGWMARVGGPDNGVPGPAMGGSTPSGDPNHDRIIQLESGGQQFGKDGQPLTSSAGAKGVGQVMPGTAPQAAKLAGLPWNPELFNRSRTGDPAKDKEAADYNMALSRAYYAEQVKTFGGDGVKAAAAYNAGPEAVQRAIQKAGPGGNYVNFLPAETQQYVRNFVTSQPQGRGPGQGPASAPSGATPVNAPGATPAPQEQPAASKPPSMQVPVPQLTPEIEAQLPTNMQPTALYKLGMSKMGLDPVAGQRLVDQSVALRQKYLAEGSANGIPLPGGFEANAAKERMPENRTWAAQQGAVRQAHNVALQSADEIVKQLRTYKPGAWADLVHDVTSKVPVVDHVWGDMPPAQYEIFRKDIANLASSLGTPTGDAHTDAQRATLAASLTDPSKQPEAVRAVLARIKGQLEHDNDYIGYALPKVRSEPRLDRSALSGEFDTDNKGEHALKNYINKNEHDIAIRGIVPDFKDPGVIGRKYVFTPEEMATQMHAPVDAVRKKFFGDKNGPQPFRITVKNGNMLPVLED